MKEVEPVPVTNSEPADDKKEGLKKEKQFKKEKKEAEKTSKKRKAKDSEAVIEDLAKVQEDTAITQPTDEPVATTVTDDTNTSDLSAHQKKRQKNKEKKRKILDTTTQSDVKEVSNDITMADAPEAAVAPEELAVTETANETETASEKKKKQRGPKKSKKDKKKSSDTEINGKITKESKESDGKAETTKATTTNGDKKDAQSKDKKSNSGDLIESFFSKNSSEKSLNLQTIFAKLPKADKARLLETITVQRSDDGKIVLDYKK